MSIYTGIPFGAVQDTVYDQMGTALPGDLYSAADANLTDAMPVVQDGGVGVGLAVVKAFVASDMRSGINEQGVKLPASGSTGADFAGIVVRTQETQTDAEGRCYVDNGRMATVARPNRSGARIWVKCATAFEQGAVPAFNVNGTTNPPGTIVGAAVATQSVAIKTPAEVTVTDPEDTGVTVSVVIPNATFLNSGNAGDLALIELK